MQSYKYWRCAHEFYQTGQGHYHSAMAGHHVRAILLFLPFAISYEVSPLVQGVYRCRQEICDFSDRLFPDDPAAKSQNKVATEHDGIFVISKSDASRYVQEFNPQILRYNKVTKCDGLPAMNFRISKGLTFDRVLIYPHKSVRDYLISGNLKKLKEPQLLYVAATRARQSVAFVLDDEIKVPGVERVIFT